MTKEINRWSDEERIVFLHACEQLGTGDWSRVAYRVKTKSKKQCRDRLRKLLLREIQTRMGKRKPQKNRADVTEKEREIYEKALYRHCKEHGHEVGRIIISTFRDPRGRNRPTPDMAVGVARSLGIVNFTLQTLLDEDSAAVPVTIRSQVPKKTVSALTPAAPTSGSPTGPTAAAVHMHMHPTDTSMARVPDQIVSGMKRKVRPSQDSTFIKYSTNQKKIPMNTHPRSSAFSLLHPNVNMNIPTQLYSSPKKKSKRHYFPSESTFSRRSSRRAHVISPDHDQFKMLPYPSLDFDLMSSLEKEHIEFHHKLQTRAYIAQTAASNASNFGATNENNNEIKNITHRETGVTFHNSIDIDNKDNDHGKIQKREVHMKHIYVNQFNHTERQAVTAMMSLQSGL